ncbi:MAG: DUF6051 family protein [Ignavibacteriota bacterium]
MGYLDDFNLLNEIYTESKETIQIPGSDVEIRNYRFTSDDSEYYPDTNYFKDSVKKKLSQDSAVRTKSFIENTSEAEAYNKEFIYPVYSRPGKSKKLIILFHGLNEGGWEKYHSWAKKLVELTGQTVLSFPISHHINRRPKNWIASRTMNALGKERQKLFGADECSFLNSAISTRLHLSPEIFFWSGIRSYYDVQKLMNEIRSGGFKEIDKDCSISLFGYSIGAFLIETLIMGKQEMFADSKAVLFCGGSTMDLMNLTSKFICDSVADRAMTDFYVNNFENEIQSNEYLKKYFTENVEDGMVFRSLLNMNRFSDFRVNKLKRFEKQILAIPLKMDDVVTTDSVRKTLTEKGLDIRINEMHFPIEYDHVLPFPIGEKIKDETDRCFKQVFSVVAEWLE